MITKIYKTYSEFLQRENKEENGVSASFAELNPTYEKQNETNKACWNCRDCSYCSGCSDCRDCSYCSYCSYCKGYESNPNCLVSTKIGSRNAQTVVYILDDNIQVICGCWRSNLIDFEKRVKEVYTKDIQHYKDYMRFIKQAKSYIKYTNKVVE